MSGSQTLRRAPLLVLAALLAPTGHASQGDPQITDRSGDTLFPGLDLTSVRFADDNQTNVDVEIAIAGGFPPTPPCVSNRFFFWAGAMFTVLDANGTPPQEDPDPAYRFFWARINAQCPASGPGRWFFDVKKVKEETLGPVSTLYSSAWTQRVEGRTDGGKAIVQVPRVHLGLQDAENQSRYTIKDTWAMSFGGHGYASGRDRAPDTGNGREFVFTAPPPAHEAPTALGTSEASKTPSFDMASALLAALGVGALRRLRGPRPG